MYIIHIINFKEREANFTPVTVCLFFNLFTKSDKVHFQKSEGDRDYEEPSARPKGISQQELNNLVRNLSLPKYLVIRIACFHIKRKELTMSK